MPVLNLAILAIIQGLTEFLPVSSSGHLVLVPYILDWPDQGLTIDVAVHTGTLVAVIVYFWRDITRIFLALLLVVKDGSSPGLRLFFQIILASIPVFIGGAIVSYYFSEIIRNIELIGWATIIFGLFLGIADRTSMTIHRIEHMTYPVALFIGVCQMFALLPGASRAGVTMTAARVMGFERADAARFSLLLGIPAIIGASSLKGLEIYETQNLSLGLDAGLAAASSFLVALLSISLMMKWLKSEQFLQIRTKP